MSSTEGRNKAKKIVVLVVIAATGWVFLNGGVFRKADASTTLAQTAQEAAEVALSDTIQQVAKWQQATGHADGAPHAGAMFAGGKSLWGASMTVKWSGGEACAIAGSLDGGPAQVVVSQDPAPCTSNGIADLQQFICQAEKLPVCPGRP